MFLAIMTFPASALSGVTSSAPIPTQPGFAYVADVAYGVYGYQIDAATGALTLVPGSPFTAGLESYVVAVDPANQFLYVGDGFSLIYGFKRNQANGALQTVGSPFAAGSFMIDLAIHPSGRFLYGMSEFGGVYGYSINRSTGSLTSLGLPFATGTAPSGMALDPSGNFLYVTDEPFNAQASSIYAYTVSPVTGALTAVSGSPFGLSSSMFYTFPTTDPSGTFLYVPDLFDIKVFSINRRNGSIQEIVGSPFPSPCAAGSIAIDPSGRFAYVVHYGYQNICGFAIDPSSGALSELSSSPYIVNASLEGITVDGSGRFVYAVSLGAGADTWQFKIDNATGALTQAGPPSLLGLAPYSVTTTRGFLNFPLCLDPPLCNQGPESVRISTVFDHSQSMPYQRDSLVTAYTGESGTCSSNSNQMCRGPVLSRFGFRNISGSSFHVNGHYTGGDVQCKATSCTGLQCALSQAPCNTFLYYQGHPGYDFRALCPAGVGTPVYAAAAGFVHYPCEVPVNCTTNCEYTGGTGKGSASSYHVLELDLDAPLGYKLYYLHLSSYPSACTYGASSKPIPQPTPAPSRMAAPDSCPQVSPSVAEGTHVNAGDMIGVSGDAGALNAPHLHFEVQINDIPIDPYGWTAGYGTTFRDPYIPAINKRIWNNSK